MSEVDFPPATYRPCRTCKAPAIDPFPDGWILELVKEGEQDGPVRSYVTPHRDDCTAPPADPRPGLAVRVDGRSISRIQIVPPPVTRGAGFLFVAPIAAPADGEPQWTPLGYTDVGYTDEGWAVGVDWVPE